MEVTGAGATRTRRYRYEARLRGLELGDPGAGATAPGVNGRSTGSLGSQPA
ncbi:MAG: hypothetical protein M3Z04_08325 [Chloroflexota bacterium]|nr:hypothetical protein [Chloroflexota bacterium]